MLRLSIPVRQALARLTLPVLIAASFGLMLLGKADALLAERARTALADLLDAAHAWRAALDALGAEADALGDVGGAPPDASPESLAAFARAAAALPAAQALTVSVYRHAIANIFGAGALIVLAGLIALLFLPELPLTGQGTAAPPSPPAE